MERIFFQLETDAWHGYSVESMWATQLSENLYRIENSPFFVKGLSFEDIVETKAIDDVISFVKTVTISGRSTYRIIPTNGVDDAIFQSYWEPLEKEGCSYEQGNFGYDMYSVDVPKTANIQHVFALLENGETNNVWDFEEGHCAHLKPPQTPPT